MGQLGRTIGEREMIDPKLLILIAENTGDQCNVHTVQAFIKEYEKEINAYRKEIKRLRKNFELSRKAHKRYKEKIKQNERKKACAEIAKFVEDYCDYGDGWLDSYFEIDTYNFLDEIEKISKGKTND